MSMEMRQAARERERERELLQKKAEEFAHDVAAVAARPEGERYFRRVLAEGEIFATGHMPGEEGAFLAGKRYAALLLWRTLRDALPPALFARIALESDALAKGEPGDPGRDADREDALEQDGGFL